MICIDCGYEAPFADMLEVGLSTVSCGSCDATNEHRSDFECRSCKSTIPFELALQHEGVSVPCSACNTRNSYNIHPSSRYKVVPSVHDLLENKTTAMVPAPRKEQILIASEIERALHSRKRCIAEAGTGTGKTLAYLVPSLALGRRVIIATATKALQDQIIEEDGPWVLSALKEMGVHRTLAVRKGKSNFACRFNFKKIRSNLLSEAVQKKDRKGERDILRMDDFLKEAAEGAHYADLSGFDDPPAWLNKIRVEECPKGHCKECNLCGYFRNLNDVATADVVVTNHTLVALEYMVPAQLGASGEHLQDFIFGPRDALVFDEAHQLEKSFESVWKDELNPFTLNRTLNKMSDNLMIGPAARGPVETVHTVNVSCSWSDKLVPCSVQVRHSHAGMEEVGSFDPSVGEALQEALQSLGNKIRFSHNDSFTMSPDLVYRYRDDFCKIYACVHYLLKGVEPFYQHLESLAGSSMDDDVFDEAVEELRNIRPISRTLAKWENLVKSWLNMRDDHVYYISRFDHEKYDTQYSLVRQPVDMARVLKGFWEKHPTTVFTSATMSTSSGGTASFKSFQRQLGVSVPDSDTHKVASPFDFKRKCATYICQERDLQPPRYNASSADRERYYTRLAREVEYWTNLTRGNALVLFASAKDLNEVYVRLRTPYPVFAQDNEKMPANVALSKYMDAARKSCTNTPREGPILLGLQSFWEGVSIKGPLLLNVILTRMPFPVPSDPLFKKRQDMLGSAAFQQLSLYPVSISARQGTGRLLRTTKDAGIAVILDARVGTSAWGAQIIDSLDVAENRIYDKPTMEKAWGFIDRYINKMLEKTLQ